MKFQVMPCHSPISSIVPTWPTNMIAAGFSGLPHGMDFVRSARVTGLEEVGAEPLRQRNVPAIPEDGQVGLQVGLLEVLRKPDAEEASQPDGDVRIPAEVKEDAEGIGIYQRPHPEDGSCLLRVNAVESHHRQGVGEHEFLEYAGEDAPGAFDRIFGRRWRMDVLRRRRRRCGFGRSRRERWLLVIHRRAVVPCKAFDAVDRAGCKRGEEHDVGDELLQRIRLQRQFAGYAVAQHCTRRKAM